ncbi:MAG: AAA family ATPase [Ruthenibacterium lactatiformans]
MPVKIIELEAENIKRVKAVQIVPALNGLTIIGGDNNQGKTSVLDAIAWALGGDKYRPEAAQREGANTPPRLHVNLSNGLVVERRGKNSALTVSDPSGRKGGQQLLNEFVEQLALDLPRFMNMNDREKADTLLKDHRRRRPSCGIRPGDPRAVRPPHHHWADRRTEKTFCRGAGGIPRCSG